MDERDSLYLRSNLAISINIVISVSEHQLIFGINTPQNWDIITTDLLEISPYKLIGFLS